MESQILTIKYDPESKQTNYKGVQNAEYLMRMQFLLQATDIIQDSTLQRYYASEMKNIAKRQVLRIDSDIKQRFCKRCNNRIDQSAQFNTVKSGKKHRTHKSVECQYCIYNNRVKNNQFSESVKIIDVDN